MMRLCKDKIPACAGMTPILSSRHSGKCEAFIRNLSSLLEASEIPAFAGMTPVVEIEERIRNYWTAARVAA